MRILTQVQFEKEVGKTQTVNDLVSTVGMKPYLVPEIIKLPEFKGLTFMRLVEMMGGLVGKDVPKSKLNQIDSFMYKWRIDAGERVQDVPIMEDFTATLEGGVEGTMILGRKMYDKGDTFEETRSGLQYFVKAPGTRIADNKFAYRVQLIADSLASKSNPTYTTKGAMTRFIAGGYVPEASERGSYFNTINKLEEHANFISRFRVSGSETGDHAAMSDLYLKAANKNGQYEYFKQNGMERAMMYKLMLSVNSAMLFARAGYDQNFRHLITEDDGREIPIGEGIIPQARRCGTTMPYNTLSRKIMDDVIEAVIARKEEKDGNDIVVLCNRKLYVQAQYVLDDMLGSRLTVEENYITKLNNKKLVLGNQYAGYQFAGNRIFFMQDNALTHRYTDRGFGIVMNTRVKTQTGEEKLNIQEYTIAGFEMISGSVNGFGGADGKTSGENAHMIHARERSMMTYRSAALMDPYSTVILEQFVV